MHDHVAAGEQRPAVTNLQSSGGTQLKRAGRDGQAAGTAPRGANEYVAYQRGAVGDGHLGIAIAKNHASVRHDQLAAAGDGDGTKARAIRPRAGSQATPAGDDASVDDECRGGLLVARQNNVARRQCGIGDADYHIAALTCGKVPRHIGLASGGEPEVTAGRGCAPDSQVLRYGHCAPDHMQRSRRPADVSHLKGADRAGRIAHDHVSAVLVTDRHIRGQQLAAIEQPERAPAVAVHAERNTVRA